jgi:hypothetical protein
MRLAGLALVFLIGAFPAASEIVRVPLELDPPFLQRLLEDQLYVDDGPIVRIGGPRDCSALTLSEPEVSVREGQLLLRTRIASRVGLDVAGACWLALPGGGILEAAQEPALAEDRPVVRFRVVETRLIAPQGVTRLVPGALWRHVDEAVRPRLEAFELDFEGAFTELREMLPLFLSPREAASVQQMIDSLALEQVEMTPRGARAVLRFEAPPPLEPEAPREAPLTEEELVRIAAALERWDAFVTFVVKVVAQDTGALELRRALLDVMLDGRHDIVEALTGFEAGARDPVPALFVEAWERLAPLLRGVRDDLPAATALRYLAFASGADALRAMIELGPAVGVDLSSDGLRRLARSLVPDAPDDLLDLPIAVDPELREIFGFGDLPPPRKRHEPDPTPPPAPSPEPPSAPVPGLPPAPPLAPPSEPGAGRLPAPYPRAGAQAAGIALAAWPVRPAPSPVVEALARLAAWVPARRESCGYLSLVGLVLAKASAETLENEELASTYHRLYRWLVKAAAWQESCWRQFVRVDGRVQVIRSAAGAVGLMQVHERVWRGFYDVEALRGDISYNARAGSEILLHYLRDYAVARAEHEHRGQLDDLARAAYAAYHGGPRRLSRWRNPDTRAPLRAIDQSFWEKYQAVKAGHEDRVATCWGVDL